MRFRFAARQPVHLPAGQASNILRGSFGKTLRTRDFRAYEQYFSPAVSQGPSGFRDLPRPFVLRAAHLEGASFRAGEFLEIGINLFDTSGRGVSIFRDAACAMARERLGGAALIGMKGHLLRQIHLSPVPARGLRVRFLTPTELKGAGSKDSDHPEFGTLFARIRDRVSTLSALYGSGPLAIDFKSMGERAQEIHMARCDLQYIEAQRYSRSTGQRHPLGGFVGVAEYEGELSEFVPYIEAARWTGVGRQTVWGKGEIDCEPF